MIAAAVPQASDDGLQNTEADEVAVYSSPGRRRLEARTWRRGDCAFPG